MIKSFLNIVRTPLCFILLCSWMIEGMNFFEIIPVNICINLGSTDTAVPKQGLHDPQICTTLQQMCGKGVPKCVRRYMTFDACLLCILIDYLPAAHPAEFISESIKEEDIILFIF